MLAEIDYARKSSMPFYRKSVARRVASLAQERTLGLHKLFLAPTASLSASDRDFVSGALEGFTGWRKAPKPVSWDAFAAMANASGDAALAGTVRELSVLFGDGRALDEVKKIALNEKAELGARKAALETLIDSKPDDLRATCEKLLAVRFLNTVAAKGLAQFDDPAIGVKLAQSYRSFHPSERAAVIEALLTRPAFAKALLDEIAAGKIERTDLSAYHARQIRSLNNPDLTKRLAEAWGDVRESAEDKRALMTKLKAQLTPTVLGAADKGNGRVAFESICATCHTLYGQGGQIGPDLTGGGRANIDYLLENIVDPGAVVSADFRLNVLTLKDGRVLNGMIFAKTDRTITLKSQAETVTVERAEIAKSEELPQSLMPEGLLSAFSETQVRDLFAYLMHPTQVPRPAASPQ
jgi:putative heme-binding domain-containing protein